MGLSVSLGNALTGMNTSQSGLEVLSRNVANSGTPGYHRQSLSVVDINGVNSTYARNGTVERAFNASLQAHYTTATSNAGYSSTVADILNQLQTYLGQPGDPGSMDTAFTSFENALQQLGTSPDNYATRASVVSQAQNMASTLNSMTNQVQGLRQETEVQIKSSVDSLNQYVGSLAKINARLADQSTDASSRASLMDQRDRLVSNISEMIDVRVDYRSDDTVGLMTRSGVGILDNKASVFEFNSAGTLSAGAQFSTDPAKNGVGSLVLHTPAGLSIDLVGQNVLQSGTLKALVDLRDAILPAAQNQLDEIAAGLAQALSTVKTEGTAASAGPANGFAVDLSDIRNGNDFTLNYTQGGNNKSVRVVRVDDTTKLPLDYTDANGSRVIGMDFSGGASSVAMQLSAKLGTALNISGSGSTLTVLDDGASNTTDITSLTARGTATGLQNGDLGLNLFVDTGNKDFTNSLDAAGQKRGFAGRIAVNSAIVSDNKLLVQYTPGGSLGDDDRANYLVDQLQTTKFASGQMNNTPLGYRLGGTISDMISQTMDFQGAQAASAIADNDTETMTLQTLSDRLDTEYGVNVDDEMSRLMELQNAYAANARVISVVQDLLNRLMEI